MKISELIAQLQEIQKEHGDLSVQIHSREYQSDDKPGVYGGGGGGMTDVWHGTVFALKVSKQYLGQLELRTTK